VGTIRQENSTSIDLYYGMRRRHAGGADSRMVAEPPGQVRPQAGHREITLRPPRLRQVK
jgi:hypothetical protein